MEDSKLLDEIIEYLNEEFQISFTVNKENIIEALEEVLDEFDRLDNILAKIGKML